MGLGLGWLRAVAQCYSYSCSNNKIELKSISQNNLNSFKIVASTDTALTVKELSIKSDEVIATVHSKGIVYQMC